MIVANDFAAGCHRSVQSSCHAYQRILVFALSRNGWMGSKTCEMTSDQWENDDVR